MLIKQIHHLMITPYQVLLDEVFTCNNRGNRMPNECEITGKAVALNCTDKIHVARKQHE